MIPRITRESELIRRAAAVFLLAVSGVALGAPPAFAHTEFESSNPADGATVDRPVDQISLGGLQLGQGLLGLFVDAAVDQPGLHLGVADQPKQNQQHDQRPTIGTGVLDTGEQVPGRGVDEQCMMHTKSPTLWLSRIRFHIALANG